MDHKLSQRCSVLLESLPKSVIDKYRRKTLQSVERSFRDTRLHERTKKKTEQRPARRASRKHANYVIEESDEDSTGSDWKFEDSHSNLESSDTSISDDEAASDSFQEEEAPVFQRKRKRRLSSSSSADECKKKCEFSVTSAPVIQSTPKDENVTIDTSPKSAKKQEIVSTRVEPSNCVTPERRKRQANAKSVDAEAITESPKSRHSSLRKRMQLQPKTDSLQCTICSSVFENREQLSDHIFKHTARELQNAYKVAKEKQVVENADSDSKLSDLNMPDKQSGTSDDIDMIEGEQVDSVVVSTSCADAKVSSATNKSLSISMCSCHSDHKKLPDEGVQIEMVLFCKICKILFRRQECFETHYRISPKCSGNRTKNRQPKLFCSTCLVILNGLTVMRRHLEEHASINYHGTVNFVCNICRVVFFGVGTVFCTHWFNHEKDGTFVASRHSFPKLCITNTGQKPNGCGPDEQYIFVAEYVCRICKLQFSSESELSVHAATACSLSSITTRASRKDNKTVKLTPVVAKRKESKRKESPKPVVPAVASTPKDNTAVSTDFQLICEDCKEVFPNQIKFEEHFVKHFQDNGFPSVAPYVCNVCLTFYHNLKDFNRHWVTHIAVIKFICTVCNLQLSNIDLFQTHIAQSCWKQKPNCRVWFTHRHQVCKICRKNCKTAEDLAKHYTNDHTKEKNSSITKNLRTISQSAAEKSLTAKISAVAPFKKNDCSVKNSKAESAVAKSCENVENVPMSNNIPVQSTTISNTSNIHKSIKKSNTRHSSNNAQPRDKNIDKQTKPDEQLGNISLLQGVLTSPSTTLISKNNETMPYQQSLMTITKSDTNVHGGNVFTSNVNQVIQTRGKAQNSSVPTNVIQSPTKPLLSPKLSQGSPAPQTPRSTADELSSSVSDEEGNLRIVEESELEAVDKVQNNVESIPIEDDEPEIIEVPSNSVPATITPSITQFLTNTATQPTTLQVAKKIISPTEALIQLPELNSTVDVSSENDKNIQAKNLTEEQTRPNSEDSASVKPQNFLRVKKFQDLQAVKDYICDQCRAAFDNMKSLTEHLVAHATSLFGAPAQNTRPTMLAALILPPVDPSAAEIPALPPSIPELIETPAGVQAMAGKRILPYIPQRVRHAEARRVSPVQQEVYQQNNIQINTQNNVQQNPQQFRQFLMGHQAQVIPQPQLMLQPAYPQQGYQLLNINQKSGGVLRNHAMAIPLPIEQSYANNPAPVSIIDDLPDNATLPGTNDFGKSKPIVYTCKLCQFNTLNKYHIFEHVRYNHFPNGQGPANVGPQQQPRNLASMPVNNPTNNVYNCHICRNYQYTTYEELNWHIQAAHPVLENPLTRLSCMYCPSINFDNEIALKNHENAYHKFTCNICLVRFSTIHELLNHQKSHQKILPT